MSKLLVLFLGIFSFSLNAESLNQLDEWNELDARIEAFYANPQDPSPMFVRPGKYSALTGERLSPKKYLKLKDESHATPLQKLAGVKLTEKYQRHQCETFLKKQFPKLQCDAPHTWSSLLPNDRVEDLTASWLSDVTYDLDEIPVGGTSDRPNWSDDYWRTRWGLTSFRYGYYDPYNEYKTYREAINAYQQPRDWASILLLSPLDFSRKFVRYSPAEKYDALVGDELFSLTYQQKNEGQKSLGPDGNVEAWMGLCHGWAPAAIQVARPIRSAKLIGARGREVEWYPGDVKALLTLAYANGSYESNYVGGRCNDKAPKFFPNGRIANQDCFDNNPATFHLSLGNLIGRAKGGFIMDKTFDYEVWNQPIVGYEFTYFNPNAPSQRDRDWRKVAVPYDQAFKKRDRFQSPLTRGMRGTSRGDGAIQKVVGVIATIVYADELTPPEHQSTPEADSLGRVSYTYDLELEEVEGKLLAKGGEWHENAHPDFLWTPRKGAFVSMAHDKTVLNYTGTTNPSSLLISVARRASKDAYPLCQVLRELVRQTTGTDTYPCL